MIIINKINNNVVLVHDEHGKRKILTGKGLGFAAAHWRHVREDAIEHIFVLMEHWDLDYLLPLLREIPLEILYICEEIANLAQEEKSAKLSPNLVLTLANHVYMTTKRNALRHPWEEIKLFYPNEVALAKKSLALLREKLGHDFTDSEAYFLALLFVNAQMDNIEDFFANAMTESIIEIINIIKAHYNMEISQDSIAFSRFVTHFRFYLVQLIREKPDYSIDVEIVEVMRATYPKEYECANKITAYLDETYKRKSNDNERVYLALHICRILEEKPKETEDTRDDG